MAPAPANSRPRPRTSSSSSSASSKRTTLLLAAGAIAIAVVVFVVLRRRSSSSSSTLDTSGTPGPNQTGATPVGSAGGASSVPGNLPTVLVGPADTVTQQVQQTDAGGNAAPDTSSSTQAATSSQSYTGPGGAALIDSSLPYLAPVPYLPSHPGVVGGGAPQINIAPGVQGPRRPGAQLE